MMSIQERILEGAATLFKTYGIKAVTMDQLASYLGISKRTIYENFTDKDELLAGVLTMMTEKQKDLTQRIIDESENAIVAIFRILEISRNHFQDLSPAFFADIKKYHNDFLNKNSGKCEMPDYRYNIQVIIKGIEDNLFRKEINPDLVNRCLFSLGRSTMDSDLYPLEQFTMRDIFRNVFISYMRGISTPEGIDLIEKLEANF
jgi:TetR/AcrR family transcriptional regulator, cholesterol catabolism regulator